MIIGTVRLLAEHRRVETDQAEHDRLPPHLAEAAAAAAPRSLDRSNDEGFGRRRANGEDR
jgi:hypothetical protein